MPRILLTNKRNYYTEADIAFNPFELNEITINSAEEKQWTAIHPIPKMAGLVPQ